VLYFTVLYSPLLYAILRYSSLLFLYSSQFCSTLSYSARFDSARLSSRLSYPSTLLYATLYSTQLIGLPLSSPAGPLDLIIQHIASTSGPANWPLALRLLGNVNVRNSEFLCDMSFDERIFDQ